MRVLIGIPTSFHKEYCLKDFCKGLDELTYTNKEILFVDNSNNDDYIEKIKKLGFNAIKGPYFDYPVQRISASRNKIIDYALANNFDYIFFLYQDTIPPKDSIERLLRWNKRVLCGICFSRAESKDSVPTYTSNVYKIIPSDKELPDMRPLTQEEAFSNELHKVISCGGACIFIHKEIVRKIRFNETLKQGEDMNFCIELFKNKIPLFCDTSIKCRHLVVNRQHVWKDGMLIKKDATTRI